MIPILAGAAIGAGSDLALQVGINLATGKSAFNCINWTQVGIGGALGAFTGGAGGAGLRTAAGLSNKFSNVSRRIRRAEDLVGSGKDLHHWLLPRRWETAFGGRAGRFVNGRWNLNPLAQRAHRALHRDNFWPGQVWASSPTWAKASTGIGAVAFGGGIGADTASGGCGCGR